MFATLGDGVVFGELSILNVPGSKVGWAGGKAGGHKRQHVSLSCQIFAIFLLNSANFWLWALIEQKTAHSVISNLKKNRDR